MVDVIMTSLLLLKIINLADTLLFKQFSHDRKIDGISIFPINAKI